jgi:hypothetical protein
MPPRPADRPVTTGPPVSFRLPLADQALLAAQAQELGTSYSLLARDIVQTALARSRTGRKAAGEALPQLDITQERVDLPYRADIDG